MRKYTKQELAMIKHLVTCLIKCGYTYNDVKRVTVLDLVNVIERHRSIVEGV